MNILLLDTHLIKSTWIAYRLIWY